MEQIAKILTRKTTALGGLTGVTIIMLASLATGIAYNGQQNQSYSIFNHFISELGNIGVSQLAHVFNIGLMVSGVGLLIFMLGMGVTLRHWLATLAAVAGVYASVNYFLVGVFPMNQLEQHSQVAMAFFQGGLVSISIFALYIIFAKPRKLPLWLLIPALLTVAAFVIFLYVPLPSPTEGMENFREDPLNFNRPTFWPLAFFEWTIFFTIIIWTGLTSLTLLQPQTEVPATSNEESA